MQAQLGLLLGAASPSGASCLSLLGLRVACLVRTICCAVFQRYGRTPGGYRATIVAGEPTWLDGAATGARPGTMLERG